MTRSLWVLLSAVAAVTTLESIKDRAVCTIRGSIHPAMALRKIWIIQDGDTTATTFATNKFEIQVKAGHFTLWIDAVAPYRDIKFDHIASSSDNEIDLGNIELIQAHQFPFQQVSNRLYHDTPVYISRDTEKASNIRHGQQYKSGRQEPVLKLVLQQSP